LSAVVEDALGREEAESSLLEPAQPAIKRRKTAASSACMAVLCIAKPPSEQRIPPVQVDK
jgi:hypothetical protein